MKKRLLVPIVSLLFLFLVGCGGSEAELATAVSPLGQAATPTLAQPVIVVIATELAPTAIVAATTVPPTVASDGGNPAIPTAIPTAVVDNQPEPTAVPDTGSTGTSPDLYAGTADLIAAGRSPFTGQQMANPDLLQRRPILCKISNAPAQWVRPQSGLNSADIVFEHYAEGSLTRFTALYHSKTPVRVGPVRSARLIDMELPKMYDAALCFSGASDGVLAKLKNSSFDNRALYSWLAGYYRSGEDKPFEHTLYANPERFWNKYLTESGLNRAPQSMAQPSFAVEIPANGVSNRYLSINYSSTFVEWRWDAGIGKYRRSADGGPIIDAVDNQQVTVENVIVVYVNHILDYSICETQAATSCIDYSMYLQLWNTGPVRLFRDGQEYKGLWHRDHEYGMLTFTYEDGSPLPLQLGNSWVQFIPATFTNEVTVQP